MRRASIYAGASLALLGGVAVGVSWALTAQIARWYDEVTPVVRMDGRLASADSRDVAISVSGQKLRDCTYLRLQTFFRDPHGVLRDAERVRIGAPETGATKPLGTFDIGTWRMWPRADAVAAVMFVEHRCDDRYITTKIADVGIP